MTTVGWGVDATVTNGVVTSGTQASDVRKVWGALYTPGIINGCNITRSSSGMSYTVSAGVAAVRTGTGEIVMAPVEQTNVSTDPAPGTGTRVDLIYAVQRFPASGDSTVQIQVDKFATNADVLLPANSVELDRYLISAGQTNTNAAVRVGGIIYSIPYGASLGVLHEYKSTLNGLRPVELTREGHGKFTLPTDRRVRFSMSAVLHADSAIGFDNSKYCEWFFLPNIQGPSANGDMLIWTTSGLHQAWATYSFEHYTDLAAGEYTTNLGSGRIAGSGRAIQHYGVDPNGYGRNGLHYLVEDIGPVE